MRKTKIIGTIGPASEDPAVFRKMCLQGLNVARLNFSHGTHEEHQKKIDMIKAVREELDLPIAIMLDTKGPEYRIKTFRDGKISLNDGDRFTFTTREIEGDETIVSVNYKGLADDLEVGDRVLVNNGLVIFEVREIEGTEIHCEVITGGVLSDRKSMSFPGKVLNQVYLSEADKAAETVVQLPLDQIDPNADQPRKRFDTDALAQLAASIRSVRAMSFTAAAMPPFRPRI